MRQSKVILHPDEIRAKLEAEGKTPEAIAAAIEAHAAAERQAQAAYDKVPPAPAYRKAPE